MTYNPYGSLTGFGGKYGQFLYTSSVASYPDLGKSSYRPRGWLWATARLSHPATGLFARCDPPVPRSRRRRPRMSGLTL